jgi:ATP-dependent Zn protease
LIELAQQRAEEFVVRHGTAIDAVASELLANEVLSAAQVAAIVAANLPA